MILSLFIIVANVLIVSSKFTIFHASEFEGNYLPTNNKNEQNVGGLPRVLQALKQPRDRIFIFTGCFIREPYSTSRKRLELEMDVLLKLRANGLILGSNEYKLVPDNFKWLLQHIDPPIINTNIAIRPQTLTEFVTAGLVFFSYTSKRMGNHPALTSYTIEDTISALNARTKHYETLGKFVYIACGCAGLKEAKDIAKKAQNIHLVISGCSDTNTSKDMEPTVEYPIEIQNNYGKKVIIAHVPGTTKYLGKLELEPSGLGGIKECQGTMLYLNSSQSEDPSIDSLLNGIKDLELGKASVYLNNKCNRRECNLGNMIADSFIQFKSNANKGPHWTDTPIALVPSVIIKSSINTSSTKGTIFFEHVEEVLPGKNRLVTVDITGIKIQKTLVPVLNNEPYYADKFLQVSGIHLRFDRRRRLGRRVVSLMCRCSDCTIPFLSDVKMKHKYRVITTENILKGEDRNHVFATSSTNIVYENVSALDAVVRYIREMKTINAKCEERIRIVKKTAAGESLRPHKYLYIALISIMYSC